MRGKDAGGAFERPRILARCASSCQIECSICPKTYIFDGSSIQQRPSSLPDIVFEKSAEPGNMPMIFTVS